MADKRERLWVPYSTSESVGGEKISLLAVLEAGISVLLFAAFVYIFNLYFVMVAALLLMPAYIIDSREAMIVRDRVRYSVYGKKYIWTIAFVPSLLCSLLTLGVYTIFLMASLVMFSYGFLVVFDAPFVEKEFFYTERTYVVVLSIFSLWVLYSCSLIVGFLLWRMLTLNTTYRKKRFDVALALYPVLFSFFLFIAEYIIVIYSVTVELWSGIKKIPSNWRSLIFCQDIFSYGAAVRDRVHQRALISRAYRKEWNGDEEDGFQFAGHRFFLKFLEDLAFISVFVPGLILRLIFKSVSPIYLPLVYVAGGTAATDNPSMVREVNRKTAWRMLKFLVSAAFLLMSLLIVVPWYDIVTNILYDENSIRPVPLFYYVAKAFLEAKTHWETVTNYINLRPWFALNVVSSLITVALYFIYDELRENARQDSSYVIASGWRKSLPYIVRLRSLISISAIIIALLAVVRSI